MLSRLKGTVNGYGIPGKNVPSGSRQHLTRSSLFQRPASTILPTSVTHSTFSRPGSLHLQQNVSKSSWWTADGTAACSRVHCRSHLSRLLLLSVVVIDPLCEYGMPILKSLRYKCQRDIDQSSLRMSYSRAGVTQTGCIWVGSPLMQDSLSTTPLGCREEYLLSLLVWLGSRQSNIQHPRPITRHAIGLPRFADSVQSS